VTAAESLDHEPPALHVVSHITNEHDARLLGRDPSTDAAIAAP
jgi:hypothetical protein